jgi:hypothetical protein
MSDEGVWVKVYGDAPEPGLPGIGGWCTLTAITGAGTKYEYKADDMDWSCFEFRDITNNTGRVDGSFTITTAGMLDTLIVSGGMAHPYMTTGNAPRSFYQVGDQTYTVYIGPTCTTANAYITSTDIKNAAGNIVARSGFTSQADGSSGRDPDGIGSDITGGDVVYARATDDVRNDSPPGWGGKNGTAIAGAFLCRVPRAHDLTGVPAGAFDTTTLRDKAKESVKSRRKTKDA